MLTVPVTLPDVKTCRVNITPSPDPFRYPLLAVVLGNKL